MQKFSGNFIKDININSLTNSICVIGLKLIGIKMRTSTMLTAARTIETVPAYSEL